VVHKHFKEVKKGANSRSHPKQRHRATTKKRKETEGKQSPFENCKTVTKNTAKMAVIVTREFSFVIGHKVEQYLQVCRVCEGSTSCNFSSH
jgi:hypothetical protein